MALSLKRFRVKLTITLALIVALVIGIYIYSQSLPPSISIEGYEALRPSCLHIRPPVGKDELKSANNDEDIYQVCSGGSISWDINVNVERTFSFGPGIEKPKQSTVQFLTDLKLYYPNTAGKSNSEAIPKTFHFIWSDEIIPTVFVDNLKLFRRKHPTWVFHFWTLKSGRKFIENNEKQILKIYDKYKYDVHRADALRYVIMYHFGGAYFDLDSEVLKPLDDLINQYECLVGPEPIENAVTILNMRCLLANSGFMCKPRHAFFRHVIDQFPITGAASKGPIYFTKCFSSFFEKYTNSAAPNTTETFEIVVAPHDNFELHVNAGVDKVMKTKCVDYEKHVRKYMFECQKPEDKHSSACIAMFKLIPNGKRNLFEACLEWISHGKDKRQQSSRSYIKHEHYGTYIKPKSLVFEKANNISNILPGVTIHR